MDQGRTAEREGESQSTWGAPPGSQNGATPPQGAPDSSASPKVHPLFPIEVDQPVEAQPREIAFVQIHRQNPDDEADHICPGDIPADEITTWGKVFEWWGGGRYRAVAKDSGHRIIRYYPPKGWMTFEGESKQLLPFDMARRAPPSPQPARGAAPPAAPPAAPAAPSEMAQAVTLLVGLVQKLDEKLDARFAAPAQGSDTTMIVAMMTNQTNLAIEQAKANATVAAEQAKANAAAAAEQAKANSTMMQSVFQVLKRDPPPPPPPPPQTSLESLVMLMKTFMPPPAPPQGLGEQVAMLKGLSEVLTPSAAAAAPDPFSKVVDFLGQAMALESQKKLAAEPAAPAPPPRNEPPRERFYLQGTGIVQVLVPDGEVRAAAPPLAAAPAPALAAAPAPVLAAAPPAPATALATAPAPAPVAASEPTLAAAPAPALTTPPAPAVVVTTAPPPAAAVAPAAPAVAAVDEAAPAAALAPTAPPTPAAALPAPDLQPVASASAAAPLEPIVQVAAPPPPSVIVEVTDADRREALRKLQSLQRLPLAERKRLLRLVPTFDGPQGDQLADILDQVPSEILPMFVDKMNSDHVGLLRHANGLITGA